MVGDHADRRPRLDVGSWRRLVVQEEGTEEEKGTYEEIRK